jgi:hypothetical protein
MFDVRTIGVPGTPVPKALEKRRWLTDQEVFGTQQSLLDQFDRNKSRVRFGE